MAQHDATVASNIIQPLIEAGLKLGMSHRELKRTLGNDTPVNGGAATFTVGGVQRLVHVMRDKGGDLVAAASGVRCNDCGLPGFVVLTAATARDALERIPAYYPLISSCGSYRLTQAGDDVKVTFRAPALGFAEAGWLAEIAITTTVTLWREAFGAFEPRHIGFRHQAPPRRASYAQHFDCPVHFGAEDDCVLFPPAVLERRARMSNAAMFRYFDEHARAELACLTRPTCFPDKVRVAILDGIEAGDASASAVARRLGMGERTMRRRLERAGRAFRDLVDQTRMAAADRMLQDRDLTISEIAHALGFSEASAFSRAYRRRRGLAPRQWGRLCADRD